jgi:hypothetical protein
MIKRCLDFIINLSQQFKFSRENLAVVYSFITLFYGRAEKAGVSAFWTH